jgi:hypothetical protein
VLPLAPSVHATHALFAGREVTQDESVNNFMFEKPNTWLLMIEFFKDPYSIIQYMSTSCADRSLTEPGHSSQRISAFTYFEATTIGDNDTLAACLDSFGSLDQFVKCACLSVLCHALELSSVYAVRLPDRTAGNA